MFLINYVNNRKSRKICPQTKKFKSFSLRQGKKFTNIFQFNFFCHYDTINSQKQKLPQFP
jgi:hypothetical protein